MSEAFDPAAVIALAVDRMAFGASDDPGHGPDPEAAADVAAILALLGGGQEEEAAQYAFDPNEPRDEGGKWTGGGGASKESAMPQPTNIPDELKSVTPKGVNAEQLASAVRDVVCKDFPEASGMSLEEMEREFDLASWKDQIGKELLTRTPEFQEWFKGSRVTDGDGKPLLVYHGTNADFERFEVQKTSKVDPTAAGQGSHRAEDAMSKLGVWFVADEKQAGRYGTTVIPTYLSIKRPIRLRVSDVLSWDERAGGVKPISMQKLRSMLKSNDADGIIFAPATQEEDEALGLEGEWDSPQYLILDGSQARKQKLPGDSASEPERRSRPDAPASYAFDPAEKRDGSGKWTAGGGGSAAAHDAPTPEGKPGRLRKALESAKGWLTPKGVARKARALAHGVRHPVEAMRAGREKLRELKARYGAAGALVIVGGYTAYYTLAAMNPGILKVPVPLTPTLLTLARLTGGLEKKLRGIPAEPVQNAREEPLDVLTALEEVKALAAAVAAAQGEDAPQIDDDVMRAVLAGMLGQTAADAQ